METSKMEKRVKRFRDGLNEFNNLVRNITEEDLDCRRREDKWSVREIIHHIADAEDLWKSCVRAAIGNPGCDFDMNWYPANNTWAEPLGYSTRSVGLSIELFNNSRKQILELVDLFPEKIKNYIVIRRKDIPDGKKYSVIDILSFQVLHLSRHLRQIEGSILK